MKAKAELMGQQGNASDHIADAAADAVLLTADNVGTFLRGLPARARGALTTLLQMQFGTLTIRLPDGRFMRIDGKKPGPVARIELKNWNLVHKALTGATIGVAESYMDGDWNSPDVTAVLELFTVNMDTGNALAGAPDMIFNVLERLRHWLRTNTRFGAKRNIAAHYDLGNAFYAQWLDPTMTYSSALFASGANDLESAQIAKYRRLAAATGIEPGHHVLEIGCGWGGFSEFLAREIGCRVTGLTISREQLAFARDRVERAKLEHSVALRFQDYREERGLYDRIVSVEMFEAVGEQYWETYFGKLRDCLKPGGKAGLQIISIAEDSYRSYRTRPDFIQRYIFPGGMLPTIAILEALGRTAGLGLESNFPFRMDYAHTLSLWRERFQETWSKTVALGFDERFRRMWEFYLHYCEAGFRAGNTDVHQLVYVKN
jgi:cyclopropane-fatty-acyl-phospholipid synthase